MMGILQNFVLSYLALISNKNIINIAMLGCGHKKRCRLAKIFTFEKLKKKRLATFAVRRKKKFIAVTFI